ncbi:putative sulfate exporter family transporter [Seohaeicola sp. SP36]|jgi:uncharacterized integral membrane protein (TIGR00698 family)|uniref:YeiH family protein n=1 Tax=unclassified Seohaeicola TaxID=2641111 RepID=UPI00237B9DF0|nr:MULTISPECIES: putative sulfate exporter family transporter [unclassified Seohaeicola]MDD9706965.1 putative sulfate exporter family transporter [Seohaeicola sp. 4SK31]MDD9734075.1 putative sulfate exporter family transporter [Seohaeicola sp. SP36]MDF1707810.1 putative sulfate exporter family transporter [Paracoccaceae bacterium]
MIGQAQALWRSHTRGLMVAVLVAVASAFLAEHYGAPVMLFALLIGMALHFLAADPTCAPGLDFAAKTILRLGVGLLGLRLTVSDIQTVGVVPALAVIGFVIVTFACGVVLARLLGRRAAFGMLAGGSVAICGASAALAIASVLPHRPERETDTLFVVIAVTVLSTVAMIAYPILFTALGLSHQESGFLIGATIHDVAQVVGAGYSISDEAGVIATFVKMLRVALLPVVMLIVMLSFSNAQSQRLHLPWFLVMFVGLAILGNTGVIPQAVTTVAADTSRWCLVVAISALGVRTSLAEIARVRPSYGGLILAETLILLGIALLFVYMIGLNTA